MAQVVRIAPEVPAAYAEAVDRYLGSAGVAERSRRDLTYETEDGASTLMLLARSRHASVRSLEHYARPGVDTVGAYVARRVPAPRRRHPGLRSGV